MHPSISYFPNQQFYGGKLLDGVTAEEKPAPQGFDWPNPAKPVAFVDVKGKEENTLDGKSKLNKEEALVVLEIVDKFLSEGEISPKDIGIISPYNGMVRHLKSLFLSRGGYEVGQKYHRLVINSVDGFQGREKEVIVVSTVRSNLNGEVGFLKDFRRLNVAITRARRGLIVVGNSETLVCDKNWGDWLEWIRKNDLEFKRKEEQEHDERNEENRKQEETLDERILKKENLTTKKENYEQE